MIFGRPTRSSSRKPGRSLLGGPQRQQPVSDVPEPTPATVLPPKPAAPPQPAAGRTNSQPPRLSAADLSPGPAWYATAAHDAQPATASDTADLTGAEGEAVKPPARQRRKRRALRQPGMRTASSRTLGMLLLAGTLAGAVAVVLGTA